MTIRGDKIYSQSTINSLRVNNDMRHLNNEPELRHSSLESNSNSDSREIFPHLRQTNITISTRKDNDQFVPIHSYSSMQKNTKISSSLENKRDKVREAKISKFFEGMTMQKKASMDLLRQKTEKRLKNYGNDGRLKLLPDIGLSHNRQNSEESNQFRAQKVSQRLLIKLNNQTDYDIAH